MRAQLGQRRRAERRQVGADVGVLVEGVSDHGWKASGKQESRRNPKPRGFLFERMRGAATPEPRLCPPHQKRTPSATKTATTMPTIPIPPMPAASTAFSVVVPSPATTRDRREAPSPR